MQTPREGESLSSKYTEEFFREHEKNDKAYRCLAEFVKKHHDGASIIDIGCGHGILVEKFRQLGLDAYGLEGSISATGMWPPSHRDKYIVHDLTDRDIFHKLPKTDIVWSTEVAEHLTEDHAKHFIDVLTRWAPRRVYFSAATFFQDRGQNPTHYNENSFEYWIDKFAKRGYCIDVSLSSQLKKCMASADPKVFGTCWWYPKNMMVFKVGKSGDNIVEDFNMHFGASDVVSKIIMDRDYYEYKYHILRQYIADNS